MKSKLERALNNSILIIIKNGFVCIAGLTIISSFFTLMANFPIKGVNEFFKLYLGEIWTDLVPGMANAFYFFISIYSLIAISYHASKHFKIPELLSTLTTLMVYFSFLPIIKTDSNYFLNINSINSNGVFLSISLGLFIPFILKFIYKLNLTLKMPKDIPKDVRQSFESVIPGAIVILFCLSLKILLYILGYSNLPDLIYRLIQTPLVGLGNNLMSIVVMNVGIALLWFAGFNGSYVFNSVMTPILATLSLENLTAISSGLEPTNIITSTFQAIYTNFGGCGSTLALVIVLLFFGKSDSLKKIAKVSFIPSIFNINETIVYGLPIIMNPILFIPFILCPLINTLLSYYSMYFGLVNLTNGIQLPWTMPIFISGFLASGFSGLILQLVLLILNILIYTPFVLKLDNKYNNSKDKLQHV